MDPLEFFEARMAEDRAMAEAATESPWSAAPFVYGSRRDGWGDPEDGWWEIHASEELPAAKQDVVSHQPYEGGGIHKAADARHIERWQPARALREAEIKREHLLMYRGALQRQAQHPGDQRNNGYVIAMSVVITRDLAAWRDHPDYDPLWSLP